MKRAPTPEMKPEENLHKEFTAAMIEIYRRVVKETGYKPTYFLQMVVETSGHEAAMHLIHAGQPSDGYTELFSRKRLDLTVEALVLQPKWKSLFTDEDRTKARKRLEDYRFEFEKYGL
jgi:hypothetical protein